MPARFSALHHAAVPAFATGLPFNRRFHLETLPLRLLVAVATIGPRSGCWLRQAEESF